MYAFFIWVLSICNVIACGESGQYWDGTGDSIGVNDSWKWGHPTDYLMVIDPPGRFTPDRRKIIQNSKPKHFITDSKSWLRLFHDPEKVDRIKPHPDYKELYCTNGPQLMKYRFSKWRGRLMNDQISYSHTSPFPAMSLAYLLGYKEIVLWGVDFVTHKAWNPQKPEQLNTQLSEYKELVRALDEVGVKVYLGHTGSMLSFLEVKECFAQ